MSNKPYIEHNEKIYEFEANFTLKREFEREKQSETRKLVLATGLNEEQYQEYQEIQKFIEEHKEEGLQKLSNKQKQTLSSMFELIDNLNFTDLYDKYCFKMLNKKYNITREEFEEILEGLSEDYGMEFVDVFVQKVCDTVFTQPVEKKQNKKPLPTWMN